MSWLYENQRNWRIALLIVMVVAFLGPWTFDLIYVPPEYTCSAPHIRLTDKFCGIPISGFRLYRWIVGSFIYSSTGLITGELVFTVWIGEFLFYLLVFLSLLPIFTTLILILRRDHPRRQMFTIISWVLAIGFSLFWGLNSFPKSFWAAWGIWFYLGLAISALILEILVIYSNRKEPEVLADADSALL